MSVQKAIYDFLIEKITAAVDGPLLNAEVHDTHRREFKSGKGISPWPGRAAIAPDAGVEYVKRSDVVLVLVCYVAAGREKSNNAQAREDCEAFSNAVALLFFNDPRMGGRCEYCRPFAARDGFDNSDGKDYAVVNLAIVINETGALSQSELEGRAF